MADRAAVARLFAADARVITRLAAQVPRCPSDETGSTPWTSFRHELALARKLSDRSAGTLIRHAVRLTTCLPRALALLDQGVLTVPRATAFLTELDAVGDELAGRIDAELADKVALLPSPAHRRQERRPRRRAAPHCR